MSTVYIDETAGSDIPGAGSESKPYQSLAYSVFADRSITLALLRIRKDAQAEWKEPSPSAMKKAQKGADGLVKKQKKAEEEANRAALEKEKRDKILQDAKQIQLVNDPSLPEPKKVCAFSCACWI